jgi:hypothetical protein
MNPIDYVYKALRVIMHPLEPDSIERKCLMRHIDNSCDNSDVIVQQIYSLETGKGPCNISNKRLLFHGSKNDNVLGILKHGLLIAPPEAPRSGLAYGKGVYFADQFSKALGYTSDLNYNEEGLYYDQERDKQRRPRSFVFVAEVSLGQSYVPSGPEYMEKPHGGTNSTQALGSQEPDRSRNIVLDTNGAIVSVGELKKSTAVSKKKYGWKLSYYNKLSDSESEKIENKRTDSNTVFPVDVSIMHHNEEHIVTLLSHKSETVEMRKVATADKGKAKHREQEKVTNTDALFGHDSDDDDESDVRVNINSSNNSSSSETTLKLHREETGSSSRRLFGQQSEFIVYDTKQVRLRYLIELTSASWVRKENKLGDDPKELEKEDAAYDDDDQTCVSSADSEQSSW